MPPISRLKALVGILLALACSSFAEAVLGPLLSEGDAPFTAAGRMALTFLTVYTLHRFALTSFSRYSPKIRDLLTLLLVLIFSLGFVWIGRILSIAAFQYLQSNGYTIALGAGAFEFAIPFAAGALLLQAVLGLHFGMFYAVALSIIMGVYTPDFLVEVPYVLSTSLMACLSLSRFRSRSAYIRAGLNISFVSLPFAFCAVILSGAQAPTDLLIPVLSAIAGGILCSFVAAGITPILEGLGGYVTDMRLLEMATLDHPLLKELSIQAPGTWNHSMVMGMMVDAAADAVGANAVLARVGAYFHDIGKMKKPLYFVENQGGHENRHDKLSCSMSALIIRSHVKDGIELAKMHKLPAAIVDMIPQHHGTSVIEYFYQKAKKEAEESGDNAPPVDRSLYSYPGPKPQTREAGILMLADGIEAAARTIKEPTPDRIQGMVQKMINKVFASGQLNECDLTLQDLHLIAKNFVRILSSIYHQRIAYAEPAEKTVAEKIGSKKNQAEKPSSPPSKETGKAGKGKSEVSPPPRPPAEETGASAGEKESSTSVSVASSSSPPLETQNGSESEEASAEGSSEPKEKKEEDLKRLGIS
ncbi:HDIG domain-containing protein [bacterium]|nr:HDIG domain-containing protein [bacterium]